MLAFLFLDEVVYDETDVAKVLDEDGLEGRRRGPRRAGRARPTGRPQSIDEALRATLVDGLGLKPRNAFGPVRVAVTGRRVSPPLFESLELLGREQSLARLDAAPRLRPRRPDVLPAGPATAAGSSHRASRRTRRRRSTPPAPPAATPQQRAASSMGGPPAPGAARLPADAAHLGLRLVEAARRDPARGRRPSSWCQIVLMVVLVVGGGRRRWPRAVRGPLRRRVQPRHGHAVVDALPQPGAGLADRWSRWLVVRVVHRLRPRWLSSVLPGHALEVLLRLPRPLGRRAGRLAHRRRCCCPHDPNDVSGTAHCPTGSCRHRDRDPADHAAAGAGGGVRLPRLPDAGLRLADPAPGWRRCWSPRGCSRWPTACRTSRCSSTASPSA